MKNYAATIQVTEYPPQLKHKVIFETFQKLAPGERMLLINDHDPVPLQYQFNAIYPEQFTWEYEEQGPEVFQVAIGRV